MNIAAVFIVYFAIKETQFHRATGAYRGQYKKLSVTITNITVPNTAQQTSRNFEQ